MPGIGSSFGFGGGGIVYVVNVNPAPTSFIIDGSIIFTIGVQGSYIDLSTVDIFISGELAFRGATASFTTSFVASSSYEYDPTENGYTFTVYRTGSWISGALGVLVRGSSIDGGVGEHTFGYTTGLSYQPTAYGVALGTIPIYRLTGEATGDPFAPSAGLAFFTPSLIPTTGSQIDINSIEIQTVASETYTPPEETNTRPFLFGPVPAIIPVRAFPPVQSVANYMPTLGRTGNFRTLKKKASVKGVLYDTVSLETTIILYL